MIATLLSGYEVVAGMILLGGADMNMKTALLYQNHLLTEDAKTKNGILVGYFVNKQQRTKVAELLNCYFKNVC